MSFDSLCINQARVVSMTAADKWIEPAKSVGPDFPCRIMYGNRLIRDYKGEEVLSVAKIFCRPAYVSFSHKDWLQLDIEAYAHDHPILKITMPQDSIKIHHVEVWIA